MFINNLHLYNSESRNMHYESSTIFHTEQIKQQAFRASVEHMEDD
jgi:hypothetical protein